MSEQRAGAPLLGARAAWRAGPVDMGARAVGRARHVDMLRGIVMVIMALDHARDYLMGFFTDPTDLRTTTLPLFFTRWITHFCAPVFVFLAGTGAYLSGTRGRPVADLRRFLWTRGLWLVLLEVTVVRFAWLFDLSYRFSFLQVIWAIGWSMVVLSFVVALPARAVGAIGVAMILLHNLLDGVHVGGGAARFLWSVLHEQTGFEPVAGHRVVVAYPLMPWAGVMMAGYAFGPWVGDRQRVLRAGALLTLGFIVLRLSNLYGDPHPWTIGTDATHTFLSMLRCEKYPPSLCFLLMTLGPALMLLSVLERLTGAAADVLAVYGRVPLFYYVLHLFLIHAISVAVGSNGHGLLFVYMVWALAVAALFLPCRWYSQLKSARQKEWTWLSYV
jgi:uncharacterized membrane protein